MMKEMVDGAACGEMTTDWDQQTTNAVGF